MELSDAQRQYLVKDQMIGPFVINFVLNAIIPWLMFKQLGEIGVWGSPGVVGDLIATMFILPVLICAIATPIVRKLTRDGKAPPLTTLEQVPGWARWLPQNLALRSLACGLVVSLLLSPAIIVVMKTLAWQQVGVVAYALVKALLCGLVALAISPALALRAMADEMKRA